MASVGHGISPDVAIDQSASPDWVTSIPERRRRHLRIWLWAGAILTACTLFIGGVTRLTESGLSIVNWEPIIGSIPPITDADWHEAFDRYKQYPEYVKLRPDMTLGEFKYIYFWEYLHRMGGRVLGVVFLVPFLFFLARGYFNPPLIKRAVLLFVLGGLQGLMGWYMVSSGLVDRPEVSHIRLAAHLCLAVIIFSCCLWFANDLRVRTPASLTHAARTRLRNALIGIGVLLGIQIFWGGLVAGLKAGLAFNTFPLMADRWFPPGGWGMDPTVINIIENPGTVQWMHRLLATLLLASTIALAVVVHRRPRFTAFRTWSVLLAANIAVQYLLGVATLLTHVRIDLAVIHQLVALLAVAVLLSFLHRVLGSTGDPTHNTP